MCPRRRRTRQRAQSRFDSVDSVRRLREARPEGPGYRISLNEWVVQQGTYLIAGGQTWMGVPSMKNPLDAWTYQEILHSTRPAVVVELGSWKGGATLMLANMLDWLGEGTVVTVDLDHSEFQAEHPRIVPVTGNTGDVRVLERVAEVCRKRRTMVIHDAAHDAESVLRDLRLYAPLVSPGCYLIVEDGITDAVPSKVWGGDGPGPLAAIRAFVRENDAFRIDGRRDQLGSFNPSGYLRRVS
jgi:cephalosporin hydroxylase